MSGGRKSFLNRTALGRKQSDRGSTGGRSRSQAQRGGRDWLRGPRRDWTRRARGLAWRARESFQRHLPQTISIQTDSWRGEAQPSFVLVCFCFHIISLVLGLLHVGRSHGRQNIGLGNFNNWCLEDWGITTRIRMQMRGGSWLGVGQFLPPCFLASRARVSGGCFCLTPRHRKHHLSQEPSRAA